MAEEPSFPGTHQLCLQLFLPAITLNKGPWLQVGDPGTLALLSGPRMGDLGAQPRVGDTVAYYLLVGWMGWFVRASTYRFGNRHITDDVYTNCPKQPL